MEEKYEVKAGGHHENEGEEMKKGMGYGKIRINERWWKWDENRDKRSYKGLRKF